MLTQKHLYMRCKAWRGKIFSKACYVGYISKKYKKKKENVFIYTINEYIYKMKWNVDYNQRNVIEETFHQEWIYKFNNFFATDLYQIDVETVIVSLLILFRWIMILSKQISIAYNRKG